jgi:hypothetical protein
MKRKQKFWEIKNSLEKRNLFRNSSSFQKLEFRARQLTLLVFLFWRKSNCLSWESPN